MILFLSALMSSIVICNGYSLPLQEIHIEDAVYWNTVGDIDLKSALNQKLHYNHAKNIIVFIGDGMGPTTVTAARIYQGQHKNMFGESNVLSFEKFPIVGLSKTYNVNKQVADSASTGTAMFCGVKIKHKMVGLDMRSSYDQCNILENEKARVSSIMTWAQNEGLDTGIVTTTRITHATPAATYAHINNRDWECDSEIPDIYRRCVTDIARQLVEDKPGSNFKVIMGGGLKQLGSYEEKEQDDSCKRQDRLNLTSSWMANKKNAKFLTTKDELSRVNVEKTDYLLGLFSEGHMSFVGENVTSRPSLSLMTSKAIEILQKNKKGFVLMVEGGRIDQAHHKNYAKLALMETVELDEAVETAINITDPSETLVIVTADHSHPLAINGYPDRGADILGLARNKTKGSFETLTYTNGPGYEYHHPIHNNSLMGTCRENCTKIEELSASGSRDVQNDPNRTSNIFYQNFAAFYLEDDTHGGEDVAIYAKGPMAHLLSGVHEQSYIAHVISYAACIGPHADKCKHEKLQHHSSSASKQFFNKLTLILLTIFVTKQFFTIFVN